MTVTMTESAVVPVRRAVAIVNSDPYKLWSLRDVVDRWGVDPIPPADAIRLALGTAVRRGLLARLGKGQFRCVTVPLRPRPLDVVVKPSKKAVKERTCTKLLTSAHDWALVEPVVEAAYIVAAPGVPFEDFVAGLVAQTTIAVIAGREPRGIISYKRTDDGYIVTCCCSADGPGGADWHELWRRLLDIELSPANCAPGTVVTVASTAGDPALADIGFLPTDDGWTMAMVSA